MAAVSAKRSICLACSRLPGGRKREKMRVKNEGGLRRGGAPPRLDPSPDSLFPRSCFRFPDYLGAWNRLQFAVMVSEGFVWNLKNSFMVVVA